MTADDIPGWFGWQAHTDRVVAEAPPGSVLVEVGVFCGKSLAYLARRARAADKGLAVVGVDHFRGSPEFGADFARDNAPNALASAAYHYLHAAGVLGDVSLLVADSVRAARLFPDGSVWSVFLDGDHREAAVAADIAAWLPKVRPGGWLGGDDVWDFDGVRAAVGAAFPDLPLDRDRCWWELRTPERARSAA